MTPAQPPAAGLDLDALEAAVAALTTSAYTPAAMRRAAVDTMVQAASTLIAEVRYFRAWQDEEDADAARINAALHEQSDTIETLRADLAARDATIAELRTALGKALDIADEGWAYAEDYFRDKHLDTEQMARLRALANPSPTEGA